MQRVAARPAGWAGLLVGGVTLFALATMGVAALLPLQSVLMLTVLRLLTGMGLGSVLPVAVSLSTEHSPARRRELVAVIVTLGVTSGSTLGGLFGSSLLKTIGPAGVFWVSGILPLILAGLLSWRVPEPPPVAPEGAIKDRAKLGRLFTPELRANTLLLWTYAFLVFVASYTLTSWVPTLLTGYGFSPSEAPLGQGFYSFGGVIGGIVLIPLAARIGIGRALIIMPLLGTVCMVVAARAPLGKTALLLALGGAGAGVVSSQIGQLTMAVSLYSAATRTTGVGWTAALGRIGSIVGPGIAGILIGLALADKDIVLITAAPVLIAAGCAMLILRRQRTAPASTPTGETATRPVSER